jgi:hypothetical protein
MICKLVWRITLLSLVVSGVSCSVHARDIDQDDAEATVWAVLEPYTASHERANWQISEPFHVVGQEIAQEFEGDPAPGCLGPEPPANPEVDPTAPYLYVEVKPRPATPLPEVGESSPTAPPSVPEPFLRRALFLLDSTTGRIYARKLFCIIY